MKQLYDEIQLEQKPDQKLNSPLLQTMDRASIEVENSTGTRKVDSDSIDNQKIAGTKPEVTAKVPDDDGTWAQTAWWRNGLTRVTHFVFIY